MLHWSLPLCFTTPSPSCPPTTPTTITLPPLVDHAHPACYFVLTLSQHPILPFIFKQPHPTDADTSLRAAAQPGTEVDRPPSHAENVPSSIAHALGPAQHAVPAIPDPTVMDPPGGTHVQVAKGVGMDHISQLNGTWNVRIMRCLDLEACDRHQPSSSSSQPPNLRNYPRLDLASLLTSTCRAPGITRRIAGHIVYITSCILATGCSIAV